MKNFKIVRLQAFGFLRGKMRVETLFKDLGCETYTDMYEALVADASVYTAGFSKAMGKMGNRAIELFYDCEALQKRWALENDVAFSNPTWKEEIAVAQLKRFQPDVLYFQDIFTLPEDIRRTIKKVIPGTKIVIIQKGYPGETRDLSDADLLLVSSPILLKRYQSLNPYLIYHSFDSTLTNSLSKKNTFGVESFTFAGSSRAPEERYWMLRRLLQETRITLWLDESPESHRKHGGSFNPLAWNEWVRPKLISGLTRVPHQHLVKLSTIRPTPNKVRRLFQDALNENSDARLYRVLPRLHKRIMPAQTLREEFPDRCQPSVFGLKYYDLLRRSEVVFNMHSRMSADTVDNMKMFEATGMGACLLTDTGRNMSELFEEDSEVVTYRSADEAIEKAKYLMEHPEEARKIAAAGRARTLAHHTMYHRCEQINEIIQQHL